MRPGRFLVLLIVVLGTGLLAWNGARFIGTKAKARTKDLDFLPPPVVAQAMSCGQQTALAKLRWIDSFAYFQLQLDRLDDKVAGKDGRGGFERLYDTLIAMDPYYNPFYEHAVLTTGGVLRQHQAALGFLMRGIMARPHETSLWRLASAELATSFGWSKRKPAQLDRWLNAWALAELDDEGRQQVVDWRRGLAFSDVDGLQTLPYWIDQLRSTKQGTALALFVEGTVRELLADHGTRELTRLAGWEATGSEFLSRMLGGGVLWYGYTLLPSQRVLQERWPHGAPAWSPVHWDGVTGELRCDPFGWPWHRTATRVVSVGREQRRFITQCQYLRNQIEAESRQRGRPPRDAQESTEWGFPLPNPPYGGRWSFERNMPDVVWPDPPDKPWPLR